MKVTRAVLVVVAVLSGGCGGGATRSAGGGATLQGAADATARASGFVLSVSGAEVTYQAPDRVQQFEHGEAQTASATDGGSASSSGPFPQTITKVFIGDRYYEADAPDGQIASFTSAQRCEGDGNGADVVLRMLRAIATSTDVKQSGDTYTFHISDQGANTPTDGTATIFGGFVRTLTFTGATETVTITAVNGAPPVTEPASLTPVSQSCG